MIAIVCVDHHLGMMFHNRRQSQDRKLREKIKEITPSLTMNAYSYTLYQDVFKDAYVVEDFFNADGYCLFENTSVKQYENIIEELYIFNWNRDYPADFYLDIDLEQYECLYEEEFVGTSHEKITLRKYRK